MRATFTDEQQALAEAARDLASGGREAARLALEGRDLPAEPTASLMSGFAGLGVPEESGGAGGGLVELAILLEALGRTVTPTPFVTHVLAVQAAHAAGLDVTAAAAGRERWSLATELDAVRDGDGCEAIVLARDGAVRLVAPGERRPLEALDRTRPLADCTIGEVRAEGGGDGGGAGEGGLRRAQAALAAELCGLGKGAVQLAADYAKVREQFGQPVGRFQAVAHQVAEAFTEVELAWNLTLYACWAVDAAAPDADRAVHAAKAKAGEAAKAKAGEAAIFAAERCTQVHGGIGITWEADPHLYLRRAMADDQWLGSSRVHRRLVGAAVTG